MVKVHGKNTIPCTFYFMNGTSIDINVAPVTSSGDVVKELLRKIGLKDSNGWSLFTVTWKAGI